MEFFTVLRILKWMGLLLWGFGLTAVFRKAPVEVAIRNLYRYVVTGFAVSWMVGWLMLKSKGYTMGDSWISNSMLMGLFSLTGSFGSAFSMDYSAQKWWKGLSIGGFVAAMLGMLVKTLSLPILASVLVGMTIGVTFLKQPTESPRDITDSVRDSVVQGFRWTAWIEGLTVLVLFVLYLPAKKVLGLNIDGGTGLIGWTHGVFVIVYVISLTWTFVTLKWSWKNYILGGFSSFFPFGTFLFERKMLHSNKPTSQS